MEDAEFTDEFCQFLQTRIRSYEAAEFLVLLAKEGGRWYSAEDLLPHLPQTSGTTMADLNSYIQQFIASGLIESGAERRFRYGPVTDQLARFVGLLVQAYERRPVTLIRIIGALSDRKIKSFADAFRWRSQ